MYTLQMCSLSNFFPFIFFSFKFCKLKKGKWLTATKIVMKVIVAGMVRAGTISGARCNK